MKRKLTTFFSMLVLVSSLAVIAADAQKSPQFQDIYDEIHAQGQVGPVQVLKQAWGKTTHYRDIKSDLPRVNAGDTNWTTHNQDVHNSRYSLLDQINTSNVGSMAVEWLFRPALSTQVDTNGVFRGMNHCTPIVNDGIMYLSTMTGFYHFAVDAATGDPIWTFELDDQEFITTHRHRIRNRGVAYGDGKIYGFTTSRLFALDAKTGELVSTFGDGGVTKVVIEALKFKYPGQWDSLTEEQLIGYDLATAPTYHDGVVYITTSISEQHPPGGLVIAVDANTGAIKWVFNTVPQGPTDSGWEIAKDTWVGGVRNGGGVWTTPAIDPELGLIYFIGANPSPDVDGSARVGINLFTNSIIACDLQTGELRWYFQETHHDIWDYDSVSTAILFDVEVRGQTVKAIGSASKPGYAYFLDRANGKPINPIVEMPVPTTTDLPGEVAFPTQPIPFKANGTPQSPVCTTFPRIERAQGGVSMEELMNRARPAFSPFLANEFIIISPGSGGGPNFGSPSFSPRTGLYYVMGYNAAGSFKPASVGNTLQPGDASFLRTANGPTGTITTSNVVAYDPASGEMVWQQEIPGSAQAGSFATAGDLVFQGTQAGYLFGFDARTGQELFRFNAGDSVRSEPITYQLNGKQYVSVTSEGIVITFALR